MATALDVLTNAFNSTSVRNPESAPQVRGGHETHAKRTNPVAAGKLRDLALLWKSGLSSSLMFNISDPLTDEPAELEAQEIVTAHLASNEIEFGPKESRITRLVEFQRLLHTSSRVISTIATLTCNSEFKG